MKNPLVFISYRRDDEGPCTRFVKTELEEIFGPEHVFMDIDNIRSGENWKNIINDCINSCDCLIVVIGKNWLQLHDNYFRRRLDIEEDWVRTEIEIAMRRGIKIFPLLIGAPMPDREALPVSIQHLTDLQAFTLSALTWRNNISILVDKLSEIGFVNKFEKIIFPDPTGIIDRFPLSLTDEQLKTALTKIDNWKVTYSPVPGQEPKQMQEITKNFVFESFEDAVNFMHHTGPLFTAEKHHPRWENLWKTVVIHLSTWDIGHKVSNLDISLALRLDEEFSKYRKFRKKRDTTKKTAV